MNTKHTRFSSTLHAKGRGFRALLSMSWLAGVTLTYLVLQPSVGRAANLDGNATCIPADYDLVVDITGPFHKKGQHSFFNFQPGDKVGLKTSELDDGAMEASLKLRIAGVEGESFFSLTSLGLTNTGTTIYWERGGACYSGFASKSNAIEGGSYIVDMTLSGAASAIPPERYVIVSTNGVMSDQVWGIGFDGSSSETGAFIWKGFDAGGEIFFDATDYPPGVTINAFAETIYALKEGILVGTVKKTMLEGSKVMYYKDANGSLYRGSYGDAVYTWNGTGYPAINFARVEVANSDGNATAARESALAEGRTAGIEEGRATGIAAVKANPSLHGLFTSADLNASRDSAVAAARESALAEGRTTGIEEGRTTGIADVQANPEAYGLTLLQVLEATGATPHTLNWYYQPEWGWLRTNKETFPYVYRRGAEGKTSGWLYFKEGSADPIKYFLYDPVQPEPPNGEPAGEWVTLEQ